MADEPVAGRPPLVPLTSILESIVGHRAGTAGNRSDTDGEFQVEIAVTYGGDIQLFTVSGRWREKGGGRLESKLHGLVTGADQTEVLPVTGFTTVQVQRILGVPVQVRRIELDLEFGDSHLWVRHNLNYGIQLLGLDVPGALIVTAADGTTHWQEVSVRIDPSQIVTVAREITFIRPDPPPSTSPATPPKG